MRIMFVDMFDEDLSDVSDLLCTVGKIRFMAFTVQVKCLTKIEQPEQFTLQVIQRTFGFSPGDYVLVNVPALRFRNYYMALVLWCIGLGDLT